MKRRSEHVTPPSLQWWGGRTDFASFYSIRQLEHSVKSAAAQGQCLCTRASCSIWLGEAGSGTGDKGEGGAVVVGGHDAAEVRGGEVLGLGMPREPLAAEAVGHPCEHGVEAQGLGVAQAAAVILT